MRSLKHLALTAAFATSAGTIGISAAQASSPAASPATTGASTTTANSPAFTCNQLGTPPKDTRLYADRMLAAWGYGQRPQVGCYAIDQVVQFAFAERGKQVGSWVFVSKVHNNEEFFDTVTYRGDGGATMVVNVSLPRAGSWDRIWGIALHNNSTGRVSTYADKLVRAWGAGDKAAALKYGTSTVVNKLWSFSSGAGGGCWVRTGTYVGARGTFAVYECESALVELKVKPGAAAAGQSQAVVGASTFGAD